MLLDPEPGADPAEPGTAPDAEHSTEPGAESGRREPVSKLAVVALVTGVLALVPIAVACAIAALASIRRTGRRGHGMAMAALFASATWVIMGSAVGTVAVLTHGFKKPVTIKYHESAVFKLREGDCVNMTSGQLVTVLPCTTPHDAEVFATFTLPASAWPGTVALKGDASSGCASRLTGYLNPQLAISLAQSYVYPNKVAWTAGTRTVICEVRAASGQLTGSVRSASSLTRSAAALAAAGRAGVALPGLRVVHLAVSAASQHRAEVDHVPVPAPGDKRGDPERTQLTPLPVHHSGPRGVPVAGGVVAGAWVYPCRVLRGHDDLDEGRAAADQLMGGRHVEREVVPEPVLPV
jgi:hypothetical protein